MAKINLLPWREELRKKRQQDFIIAIGVSVVITCILYGCAYLYIESLKDYQNSRNERLNTEIAAVDKKITEIKEIEEKKLKLTEKITLIQDLQESRPKIVHLFDELRKITPRGIFLTSLVQTGSELVVNGKSESNAMISEYMKAIEQSLFLTNPRLKIVKGETASPSDANATKNKSDDFTMLLKQKDKPKPKEAEKNSENKVTDQAGAK